MYKYLARILNKVEVLIEKYYYLLLGCILAIACYNFFYNLGSIPIGDWDEARHGVNAYEMLKNKNFIVNTFGYETDYYNLKPPLSYWMVMLGYKIFGYSALGLRAFSALLALGVVLVLAFFMKYKHGKIASLITSIVMATTNQYVLSHSARTGDADSLFVFVFTLAMIAMLMIDRSIKYLYFAGILFSLAFLAKSWHAGAIAVIGVMYLIFTGKVLKLKLKNWLFFFATATLPILVWGIFRYSNDGTLFFKGMVEYDLLSRTATPLEGHTGDFWTYFEVLAYNYFYWLVILFGTCFAALALENSMGDKERNNYIIGIILWIVIPFAIFTKAETKLHWYIIPIYPVLAICIGAFSQKIIKARTITPALKVILIISIMFSTYKNELNIYKKISFAPYDSTQNILQNLGSLSEFRGTKIYTEVGTYNGPISWDQNDFLTAELFGDLIPINGGMEAFLKDEERNLLLIPKNESSSGIVKEKKLKILLENNETYLVTKESK